MMKALVSGVMMLEPLSPLMSRNQMMLVTAMPLKTPILREEVKRLCGLTLPAAVVVPFTR